MNGAILRTIYRDEKYRLPERIAKGLSTSLRDAGIALLGNVDDIATSCGEGLLPPYGAARKVHGSRDVEPSTDFHRR